MLVHSQYQSQVSDWYFTHLFLYIEHNIFLFTAEAISPPHYLCVLACSVDSFREAPESREGSSQCHPVQSPTHDPRQEVPPQDIQVLYFIILNLMAFFFFISGVCFTSQPEDFTPRNAPSWILTLLDICVRCRQCCVGTELVDWLVLQSACVLTRSHAVGMWQALLEEGVLNHGEFLCWFLQTLWTVRSQLMHITKMVSWSFCIHWAFCLLLLNAHVGVLCYLKYFFF